MRQQKQTSEIEKKHKYTRNTQNSTQILRLWQKLAAYSDRLLGWTMDTVILYLSTTNKKQE